MAKWLDKYEQGGLVLKQKTKDNYGKKPNPNDVTVSSGPNYVGMGNDITGRDYSPAWGGQFQSGGFLEPISYKLPSRYRIPYAEPSTELATSIGGEKGEPAYLIPTFKGGKDLKDPVAEYRKTGEHLGGPFKTWQEAEKWEQEIRHPYVEKGKPIPTPLKRWGDMQDGGYVAQVGKSIPTTADSLALYKNAKKVLDYYNDKRYVYSNPGPEKYDKKKNYKSRNKLALEDFNVRNKTSSILVPTGSGKGDSENMSIPLDLYYKKLDANRYLQREIRNGILDTRSPIQLFDNRITPTMYTEYVNADRENSLYGDNVGIFSYDPILVKPVGMLTSKERALRLKRYGKESGLIDEKVEPSISTEKSKTELEKKKTPVIKKSEETKPAPYTPTGSKKYIVNGMEVSEEDFLGSGATTGGGKRVIYNTPNKGKQQVLRLDGTPETDPDKIRRALATAQKDDGMNMQDGGKMTLPEAIVYGHKNPKVKDYFNKVRKVAEKYLDEYNEIVPTAQYHAMEQIYNKYGAPKINTIGEKDRPYYNAISDTMSILTPTVGNYDDSKDEFLDELSHKLQANQKGRIGFIKQHVTKDLLNAAKNVDLSNLFNKRNWIDAYEKNYTTPGTLEYEAHKVIKPKLEEEYRDVQSKQYRRLSGEFAMGGSLPGAVGFTYARVAGSAPANGKYTKKTKASAQNGKEMKFYQDGLDFKPNSIAQDGEAIVDPMGQWAHPGEVTIIPATDITMEGVDYPVLGISDTGDQQMMYPGEDYNFDGEYVTEYPMMKNGGWLDKYK